LEDIVEWKNNDLEYLKSDEGIKEIFISSKNEFCASKNNIFLKN
jgi:hypothetical protein